MKKVREVYFCDKAGCSSRCELDPAEPDDEVALKKRGWMIVRGADGTQHFCPNCRPEYTPPKSE